MSVMRPIELACMAAVCLLAGCANRLPTYPVMSDPESLAVIADRQARVMRLSAECDLDLTDSRGQRVSLDAVLLMQSPTQVRLRAWKFGYAVFDLTLTEGQGWMFVSEGEPGTDRFDVSKIPSRQLRDALDLLGPSFFRTARSINTVTARLVVQGPALGHDDVLCEIDRATLTPRRFIVGHDTDSAASELALDAYAMSGEVVWPQRLRLRSVSGEVLIRIRELEVNGELPDGAFVPPRRAKALP